MIEGAPAGLTEVAFAISCRPMSAHEASADAAYAPSAYDPYGSFTQQDPQPFYVRLRDESPLHYDERYDCWYLSRFEDIWREEQDLEAYTIVGGPTPPQLLKRVRGMPEEASPFEEQNFGDALATLDPPTHSQLRGQLSPHFKPKAARGLEALTRKLVRAYVDELVEKGGGDVIGELAMLGFEKDNPKAAVVERIPAAVVTALIAAAVIGTGARLIEPA